MHVNDRGSKKWTSMMLPEHVEALKKLFAEYDHKEKPSLDAQQKKENEYKLQQAIINNLSIDVKYFKDNDFYTAHGKVSFIQTHHRYLQLDDIRIKLDDIIEVYH